VSGGLGAEWSLVSGAMDRGEWSVDGESCTN